MRRFKKKFNMCRNSEVEQTYVEDKYWTYALLKFYHGFSSRRTRQTTEDKLERKSVGENHLHSLKASQSEKLFVFFETLFLCEKLCKTFLTSFVQWFLSYFRRKLNFDFITFEKIKQLLIEIYVAVKTMLTNFCCCMEVIKLN